MTPSFAQIDLPIVVTTDKTSYAEGDIITVSGEVKDILGEAVSVMVISPNGNIVRVDQLQVGADKKFSVEIVAGGTMKSDGTYTIKVTYGGPNRTAETTFEFGVTTGIGTTPPSGQSLTVEGFGIGYQISGGSVISITPDFDSHSLIIVIEAVDDGELTITLPREVIDAKLNGEDDEFFVLVDAEEVPDYDEIVTETDRTLTIPFFAGSEEIEIIGTFVIPEFGTIAALILAVAIISIIVVSAKTRLSIMPKY